MHVNDVENSNMRLMRNPVFSYHITIQMTRTGDFDYMFVRPSRKRSKTVLPRVPLVSDKINDETITRPVAG